MRNHLPGIECAFVAAGLLQVARGRVPREWRRRRPLLMGEPEAVDRACEIFA
ncbi:MAG: hypothetical protein H0T52_06560 [Lautropia sp.]|nr:hypothetical protein [Lautropia sp.]